MNNNIKTANSEAEFKQLRAKTIGSSEIGTIMGVNPFQTPYDLWLRKTGRETFEGNEATRRGQLLEPVVAQMFVDKTGIEIEEGGEDVTIYYAEDFMSASPDRFYLSNGERAILEIKTTAMDVDADNLPMYWFCQLQWQMGVIGVNKGAIAWLGNRFIFDYLEFDFDADFFNNMKEAAREFWQLVQNDEQPSLTTTGDVLKAYPSHKDGKYIVAGQSIATIHKQLKGLQAEKKAIDGKIDELKEQVQLVMNDAEAVLENEKPIFTWKKAKDRVSLDAKTLKAEMPDVFKKYSKVSTGSRTFLIK